jgi:hypothetical protein
VSIVYVTALFDRADAAAAAKRALGEHHGVTVRRAFVIGRDARGFHVDGRFAGEPPSDWLSRLSTALARLARGTSREEDSVAVSDAESELAVGASALVALIDERDRAATDDAIHGAGGTMIRIAPGTLDAEDHDRFFDATSVDGISPRW